MAEVEEVQVDGDSSDGASLYNSSVQKDVTPKDILSLAKGILGVAALLALVSCGVYVYLPENPASKEVFEYAKTILPPIVTLVIGFYFRSTTEE
ncbi:MAG: hypothetical protein HQL56_18695 [Magnetococcales bacterium]|nr:hypothetical protein [Magnetococcales bacterium]